ncbi:hypothetical protein X975_26930, partial [Stegodyphus mimosarum]
MSNIRVLSILTYIVLFFHQQMCQESTTLSTIEPLTDVTSTEASTPTKDAISPRKIVSVASSTAPSRTG